MDIKAQAADFQKRYAAILAEIGKIIVGHEPIIRGVVTGIVAGGHVLLEGAPGLGKTLLVRTLSHILRVKFSRIQFTPDLMPADITGTNIVVEDEHGSKRFEFQKGPVFANILLADEINRATPKTQSALLECMEERHVTVSGQTHPLPAPFFVMATQNPIEMEGTYPLPEAQMDRFFFKLKLSASDQGELSEIINRTTGAAAATPQAVATGEDIIAMRDLSREVPIASHVKEYVARVVLATQPDRAEAPPLAKKYVRYGASPRAAQALVLGAKVLALSKGRYNVSFEDVREIACPAMRHRLILNFEGEAEDVDPDRIIAEILGKIPEM
ncbi:MAG: AAA family ATPase [Planctomycetota bacterium]